TRRRAQPRSGARSRHAAAAGRPRRGVLPRSFTCQPIRQPRGPLRARRGPHAAGARSSECYTARRSPPGPAGLHAVDQRGERRAVREVAGARVARVAGADRRDQALLAHAAQELDLAAARVGLAPALDGARLARAGSRLAQRAIAIALVAVAGLRV